MVNALSYRQKLLPWYNRDHMSSRLEYDSSDFVEVRISNQSLLLLVAAVMIKNNAAWHSRKCQITIKPDQHDPIVASFRGKAIGWASPAQVWEDIHTFVQKEPPAILSELTDKFIAGYQFRYKEPISLEDGLLHADFVLGFNKGKIERVKRLAECLESE